MTPSKKLPRSLRRRREGEGLVRGVNPIPRSGGIMAAYTMRVMIDTDSFDIAQFGHIVTPVKNGPRHRQIRAILWVSVSRRCAVRSSEAKVGGPKKMCDRKMFRVCFWLVNVVLIGDLVQWWRTFFHSCQNFWIFVIECWVWQGSFNGHKKAFENYIG